MASIAEQSALYVRVSDTIREATEHFLVTGIAFVREPVMSDLTWRDKYREYSKQPGMTREGLVRRFLRMVAKEQKRPFVYAHTGGWRDASELFLTIPKKAFLRPVIFSLLIGSRETNPRSARMADIPLSHYTDMTNCYFFFRGETGRRLFDAWYEQCRTDPAFRKALKLPAVATPQLEAA